MSSHYLRRKKFATLKKVAIICLSATFVIHSQYANHYQFSNFSTAYIISANTSTDRYQHAHKIATALGLNVQFVPGVLPDSDEVVNFYDFRRSFSLYEKFRMPWALVLGHRNALNMFARTEGKHDEWALIFEDDVAFHNQYFPPTSDALRRIIDETARLSSIAGFFYLGLCSPSCIGDHFCMFDVQIQRCWGLCTHAYAISRRKAETIFEEVLRNRKRMKSRIELRYHIDQLYNSYFQSRKEYERPYLVGQNMMLQGTNWHGLVYQDRWKYGSIINKHIYNKMEKDRAIPIKRSCPANKTAAAFNTN